MEDVRSKVYATRVMPDGERTENPFREALWNHVELHIFSGSFNPLHDGHREIFYNIQSPNKYFEISRKRNGKSEYDDLDKIVKQFEWYAPVLLTEGETFLEKWCCLGCPKRCVFHMGFDTFRKVWNEHSSCLGSFPFRFVVYDRWGESITTSFGDGVLPNNVSYPGDNRAKIQNISSTEIREKLNLHPEKELIPNLFAEDLGGWPKIKTSISFKADINKNPNNPPNTTTPKTLYKCKNCERMIEYDEGVVECRDEQ